MRTGTAHLPLHYGAAPRWLFERMTLLAREIVRCLVEEAGPEHVLARLSDPFWFQAFGSVLGFDWHSSGLTTTACGALKEGLRGLERDTGIFVAGGKGKTSRKTPAEIAQHCETLGLEGDPLIYASRLSAKVDNNALQDGYQIYQHTFFFTRQGHWAVVQQGMNEATAYARRYHWLSESLISFVDEPHAAICSQAIGQHVLNLVAHESEQARQAVTVLSHEKPDVLVGEVRKMQGLSLPRRHEVLVSDIRPDSLARILLKTYERQPEDFERLLGMQGVGAKTLRALSLIADLLYGVKTSLRDPARFSFAHGGKDGHPYPVDRDLYDRSIEALRQAVERAKIGDRERLMALRRLASNPAP